MLYDLIIVGGGPAGVSAGIYAARKKMRTALLAVEIGGQSTESVGIENWVGTIKISGENLNKQLEAHLRAYGSDCVDIKLGEWVNKITKENNIFKVEASNGTFESRAVLVTTGSTRKNLEIPGAKEFENKGISYCASCDGPLFSDQDVAVIGAGNAAFETAAQLLAYCKSVTILVRSNVIKADETTVESVMRNPKVKVLKNALPKEIKGNQFVSNIIYTDLNTDEDKELNVSGIFVEIGLIPSTKLVEGSVELNKNNQIIVDPKNQRSKLEGLWAAGDCADGLFHQNNIAVGDAIKAAEDVYLYLHKNK